MGQVIRQTGRAALENDVTGEAARVAYYAFLALFPFLLVVFALTGIVGGEAAFRWITSWLEQSLPGAAAEQLETFVAEVTLEPRPGILSIGMLLLLWSASNVFAALAQSLNRMYRIREERGFVRQRLVALGILLIAAILLIAGAIALLAGPELGQALELGIVWDVLRWPLALLLIVALFFLVYLALPNRKRPAAKGRVFIGAVVGALLWLLGTVLFRLYVANFGAFGATYGVIAGVIVLLLWLYVTALAILVGGQLAAVLEERAGKVHGDEVRRAA